VLGSTGASPGQGSGKVWDGQSMVTGGLALSTGDGGNGGKVKAPIKAPVKASSPFSPSQPSLSPDLPPAPSWLAQRALAFTTWKRMDLRIRTGLHHSAIEAIMDGERWPGPRQLVLLANATGMRPGEIVEVLLPKNLARWETWGERQQAKWEVYKAKLERWREQKEADGTWEDRGRFFWPSQKGEHPCHCFNCGRDWMGQKPQPKQCPTCLSLTWFKEGVGRVGGTQ
jgi:hypothetical protein